MNAAGWRRVLLAASFLSSTTGLAGTGIPDGFHLPAGRDAYFVENDLVYRRFLELTHDGVYRQIDQDRLRCAEVDGGTWEQTSDGTVRLHSKHHALRFRALLAGPLTVVLDSQAKFAALPGLAEAIRRFLATTEDRVFNVSTLAEFDPAPGSCAADTAAQTYDRGDLQSLLRQIENTEDSERTGVYTFAAVKVAGTPGLLILQDAVFQPSDLPRVRREYRVATDARPPFYFTQVDARVYAREVGKWRAFQFVGGME